MADYGGVPLKVQSREEVLAEEAKRDNINEETPVEIEYDQLTSHILSEFEINRRAKIDSGIEKEILDSRRANNGEYSAEDIARIQATGGSQIFMNITSTKTRALKSWMTDILKPPIGEPWSLEPSPIEDLPEDIRELLKEQLQQEFEQMLQPPQAPEQPQDPNAPRSAQPPQPPQPTAEGAQETIREQNQKRRDIEQAVADEIHTEAKYQLKKMERKILDQLKEGDWDQALSDFIDDFVVDPCAFMKGPIVSNAKGLVWKDGEAVEVKKYKHLNERVDALDMYPAPTAKCIDDGNLFEHMRFSRAKIESLKGVKNYIDEKIDKVLEEFDTGMVGSWVDTGVEQDKADIEKRGSFIDSSKGIVHALHFWGSLSISKLREWDYQEKIEGLEKQGDNDVVSVEAIMVGNHVIKCVVNDDPLARRPYYKASYRSIPGSFWGRSLPAVMSPVQRMCNATARALANNMGIASGPQIELYVDRLADAGPIEQVIPFRIWQLKSDPTGAGGRAIHFWQPTSNAQELLTVYQEFERKADDVTGIPQYAYGNEKTAGATNTAAGLAMLFESTSKIVKDCIRSIDEGLIKRRVMYQFHQNMINEPEGFNYTGDINVFTIGSRTLSIRGAEATRRNEFLQATANPMDMEVMGVEGRAAILRKMGEDLGLPNVIPTPYELKLKQKKAQEQAQQLAEIEAQKEDAKTQRSLQATQIQIDGQKEMHQGTLQVKFADLQAKQQKFMQEMQIAMGELQRKINKDQADSGLRGAEEQGRRDRQSQEIGLKMTTGMEGI
jgi:hypothetical protein